MLQNQSSRLDSTAHQKQAVKKQKKLKVSHENTMTTRFHKTKLKNGTSGEKENQRSFHLAKHTGSLVAYTHPHRTHSTGISQRQQQTGVLKATMMRKSMYTTARLTTM